MNAVPQNGFTLVEVLISIIVLAIGILGVAGMQLAAVRTSQQAAFHGAAMQIAASIADRLRANERRATPPANPNPYLAVDYRADSDPAPSDSLDCYASDCSGAQLAEFDIEQWKAWIRKELPSGRLRICRDSQPWDDAAKSFRWECSPSAPDVDSMVIKIGWRDKRDIDNPDNPEPVRRASPPAVVITLETSAR